ncbi:hypothetical protein GCK32_009293 [Trichostrongylus colubriformis]|uniref:C6 domain-containing protein n=1 Tax=Trichostrongylus colubriformis TaxID=6319 RepID=A0AAN8FJW2_TRICO
MSRKLVAVVLLLLSSVVHTCVRTTSTTTTTTSTTSTTTVPCCTLLSQSSLPRRAPLLATFQQCSILRRASSNCPADGYVFCDAAPDTNPTMMQIEFFNSTGSVVRTVQRTGTTLNVRIVCQRGIWVVHTAPTATTSSPIAYVSCSQTGSIGADWGYIVGSATD